MSIPVFFDPNTPEFLTDTFAETQPQLQSNFQALYNAFQQNHIQLDAISDAGNHTVAQMSEQIGDQQTNISEYALYSKNVPTQTDQIFLRNQSNGQVIQLSTYQIYSVAGTSNQPTQFFTFLPGNILLYFGTIRCIRPSTPLFMWPPVATNIMTVSFCGIGTGNAQQSKPNIVINAPTPLGFITNIQVKSTASSTNFVTFYYAILANIQFEEP